MTLAPGTDALGLGGLLPGPGWVVLDAARNQRFTGELVAIADEEVRVYFDRGRIYVAERASDPPLGTRLVDAGALNRAQLEYGMLKIGTIEHLGRLFDRVPSVNRDGVLVINELMTEQCVRWLAAQSLESVVATPYRHHESGMHRWEILEPVGSPAGVGLPPDLELPAPPPDAIPVIAAEPATSAVSDVETGAGRDATPEPADTTPAPTETSEDEAGARRIEPDDDLFLDVVEWDEPSSLEATRRVRADEAAETAPSDALAGTGDWVDALDHRGVAESPTGSAREHLTPLEVRRPGEFELIWPSGEVDDVTEDVADEPAEPGGVTRDADRISPAARVASTRSDAEPGPAATDDDQLDGELDGELDERSEQEAPLRSESRGDGAGPYAEPDTDVFEHALAVRRAVATIDTGSLDARRRLAATPPPGRLVVEREHHLWRTDGERTTTSVFDEQPVAEPEPAPEVPLPSTDHEERSGALRRLISSLRRG